MSRLEQLLLIWALCDSVFATEDGLVQPLDYSPTFDSGDAGTDSFASAPLSSEITYPQRYDPIVSSSVGSYQRLKAPRENAFSPESFGFNYPIVSQSFHPSGAASRLVAPPDPRRQQPPLLLPIRQEPLARQEIIPLRYDIRQIHDADYKVYKPEQEQGEEILDALKKNPSVSAYFQPTPANTEEAQHLNFRRHDANENIEIEPNFKSNPYIAGPVRIRRYATGGKKYKRRQSDEDDSAYDYKSDYESRPKAFDSDIYNSEYKEEKDPNKDYEYSYGDDSGYDHKEYERIKELSEKQAAEIKQNPGNCKEVKKDGMTCMTCKDPKTGGNYESCSYVTEPKNNKYAYSKEKKFNSNDEPDEPENSEKVDRSQKLVNQDSTKDDDERDYYAAKPNSNIKKDDDESNDKYKAYYIHSSKPKPSEALRAASQSDNSEEQSDSLEKPYNYKQALPGFYTDNEPKKDVEHVLAEFKKKDRSTCKKVNKNGMTCYQCIDKSGLKNEECMFVSESAPQKSHLAYQEVKEFTSKPPTIESGNEGAESKTVTSVPTLQKSAAYVVANNGYGKKLKRKKVSQRIPNIPVAASSPIHATVPVIAAVSRQPQRLHKVKRSVEHEPEENAEERAKIVDETNIAPPEEFAGDSSNGAFWAETVPRYSAALGVTLPEFMLAPSEHETSFDEVVAGA